jgi:molybdate transport system substrate-binding protein
MVFTRRFGLAAALAAILVLAQVSGAPRPALAQAGGPTVFAAASLKNALDAIAGDWVKAGHAPPKISYAGSNTLAKQLEQGAPADIFFSADRDWMDYARKKNTIRPGTSVDLLGNRILLIAPKDAATPVDIRSGFDLAKLLDGGKLAMANVEAVPAGKYGKTALEKLGAWEGVKDRIAQADNVRAAMQLVARGEAPLGIVYATDAAADPTVRIVGSFPEDSYAPIVYPVALTKDGTNPDAAPFLAYLRGPEAKAEFEKQGFTVLNRPAGTP